ncbi:MAG: hypothetical protein ABI947_22930 [Chloroflexota bacterium]
MLQVTTLDSGQLLACLEALPPLDLLGVALLRQCQPTAGGWFPRDVPVEQVIQATVEMVAYGTRSTQASQKLANLRPVPLNIPVVEFPL